LGFQSNQSKSFILKDHVPQRTVLPWTLEEDIGFVIPTDCRWRFRHDAFASNTLIAGLTRAIEGVAPQISMDVRIPLMQAVE
jgi:hypothetical protein